MQKKAKLAAVKTACKTPGIPSNVRVLLSWLGPKTANEPAFTTTYKEISAECPHFEGVTGRVKAAVHETRMFLPTLHKPSRSPEKIWIDLPKKLPAIGPVVRRRGRIGLTFNDGRSSPALDLARSQLKEPVKMWEDMVHAKPINELALLFDSPAVRVGNRTVKGLWAGSGEVKAAHLVGECTSLLIPRYTVVAQRWADWGEEELERKRLSILILGSAILEPKMERLRDRERWRKQQKFHFEQLGKTKQVYIRKGSLEAPEKTDKRFRYSPKTSKRLEIDFGLISYFKDEFYEQTLIAMQGITTVGTLAAARMLCTEDGVKLCRRKLRDNGISLSDELPGFEMLLKVQVRAAAPDVTSIVDVIIHKDEL